MTGSLQDYNQILAQSASQPNIHGPALVMRAFLVETMTDLWGDMPFREAGKGRRTLTPKYDTQPAIYDSVFASLEGGGGDRRPRESSTGRGSGVRSDGGDPGDQPALWVKLANSLHARAAMRISKVDPAKSKAELLKVINGR